MRPGMCSATMYGFGLLLVGLLCRSVAADTEIRLGVYTFPPIADVTEQGEADGLLGDLLAELTNRHEGLSFRIIHTSPQRRHMDFEAGLYDVIFFESPQWSWQGLQVDASHALLKDDEVYVALNQPGRDQRFFDNIAHRTIVAISGYHYGFAGLSTDNDELRRRFNIEFSHSHTRNLNLIKANRPSVAEVAIVSRSFLHTYLKEHPEEKDLFLVSDREDQSYQLGVLSRTNGPIDVKKLESLIHPLIEDGTYANLIRRYGLQLPPHLLPSMTSQTAQ